MVLNVLQDALVHRLRELAPEATTILLFGSTASGHTDSTSDYDLLILTPEALKQEWRDNLKRQLRAEFGSLNLDLIFSSEWAFIASLPYEPARRFWLENAVLLWGRWPLVESYPPLAKGALLSHLEMIAAEIDLGALEEAEADQARVGLDALEHLLHIKLALDNDYRNWAVWAAMEKLLGVEVIQTIRTMSDQITSSTVKRLYALLRRLRPQLIERVNRMPESITDQAWKASWQEHESAETTGVSSPTGG